MASDRHGHAVAVYNGLVYVIGGHDGESALMGVEVFDGNEWRPAPSMNERRYGLAAVVINGSLYAVGGKWQTTIERLDGDQWIVDTSLPKLAAPRRGFAATFF